MPRGGVGGLQSRPLRGASGPSRMHPRGGGTGACPRPEWVGGTLAPSTLLASLGSWPRWPRPGMMRRDRERLGLREYRAAWLLGITVREYRELEAGDATVTTDLWDRMVEGVPVAASRTGVGWTEPGSSLENRGSYALGS